MTTIAATSASTAFDTTASAALAASAATTQPSSRLSAEVQPADIIDINKSVPTKIVAEAMLASPLPVTGA